jgi:lipopolysaccharide transport system ATP-binding protein
MQSGSIRFKGSVIPAIETYLSADENVKQPTSLSAKPRKGNGELFITNIYLASCSGFVADSAISGDELVIGLSFETKDGQSRDLSRVVCSVQVLDAIGDSLFLIHNRMTGQPFGASSSKGTLRVRIPKLPLPAGDYSISYSLIKDGEYLDSISQAKKLKVESGDFYGTGEIPPSSHGKFLVQADWTFSGV